MAPLRSTLAALSAAVRGAGSLLVVLVVVGAIAWLLASRGASGAGATAVDPATLAGASIGPSPTLLDPTPTSEPTPNSEPTTVLEPSPTPEPAETPAPPATTATPTANTTPDHTPTATPVSATPKPTPKSTPKPTPKPTHDPAPEPTPVVFRDSGAYGQTLSAGGVTAYLQQRAQNPDPTMRCVSGDPDWQGYTEKTSFDLRMTWSNPSEAMEPFVGAGSAPYFYVIWWERPFESGADNVVTVCTRPGDAAKALISVESNGGPPRSYRFTFNP